MDLSNFYEKASGYILLAVDIKVLTTFSQVWDGKYLDVPITFIQEISKIFDAKNGSINYFKTEENDIFSDIKKARQTTYIGLIRQNTIFHLINLKLR